MTKYRVRHAQKCRTEAHLVCAVWRKCNACNHDRNVMKRAAETLQKEAWSRVEQKRDANLFEGGATIPTTHRGDR